MTYQVKEGDVLEYRGDGHLKSAFPFEEGKAYKVENGGDYLFIRSECGARAYGCFSNLGGFGFHLVPSTPPATIQHEGYNYTRGEPVVPEWVKDGAWVVHKESGELNQLIAGDPGYFRAVNKKTWHAFVLDFHPSMSVSDVFRPFTDADWKWGMWAEYKGEKVFVSERGETGIYASKPSNGYFHAPFSEITPTTAP